MKISFELEKKENSYILTNKKLGIYIKENNLDTLTSRFNKNYQDLYLSLGPDKIKKLITTKIKEKQSANSLNNELSNIRVVNSNSLKYFFIKLISIFAFILIFLTIIFTSISSRIEFKTGSAFWSEVKTSIHDLANDVKTEQNPNKEKILQSLKIISEEFKPYFKIINETMNPDTNKD